jgi:predicted transcriptional regulator of viral defense system
MNDISAIKTTLQETVKADKVADWLLSHGISAITTDDIATLLRIPKNQVRQRLAAPRKRGEFVSPARGLWVPVSYEFRTWGAPEALSYIDFMMNHLDADYYVGWMSAAAILGASHHAPQVFQVAVSKYVESRTVGRSNLNFYQRENVGTLPTFRSVTKTGTARVSTRAATMLSIAHDMNLAAGTDNAANIIIELSETEDDYVSALAECAGQFPISALRRVGWILENFAETEDLSSLKKISSQSVTQVSKLSMYNSYTNRIDQDWSLDINTRIEPDV